MRRLVTFLMFGLTSPWFQPVYSMDDQSGETTYRCRCVCRIDQKTAKKFKVDPNKTQEYVSPYRVKSIKACNQLEGVECFAGIKKKVVDRQGQINRSHVYVPGKLIGCHPFDVSWQ